MGDENIYLFVPNLIGYSRIVLAFVAFYFMPSDPWLAASFYLLSGLLDAFDGHAARALNQCTKFGAVLDMITDRCCTACLLVTLAIFYQKYAIVFQLLIFLDICSHWAQVYSNLLIGSQSHKAVSDKGNAFLRLYYTSRVVLFLMCAGNELFFAMLYVLHFTTGPAILGIGLWTIVLAVTFPICFLKNAINVIQLFGAFEILASVDKADRSKKR